MLRDTSLSVPPLAMAFPLALALLFVALAHPALAHENPSADRHGENREMCAPMRDDASLPAVSPASPAMPQENGPAPRAGNDAEAPAFFLPLPENLRPEQRKAALAIIAEAEPRLSALHREMSNTLVKLHDLSFAEDTPPEELGILGRKLVGTRNAILMELKTLCEKLEHETGFNPGWGSRRTCAFRQPGDHAHRRSPERGRH